MPRLTTLNSWKEIADYLARSVRTVQRWEARFGLPVRHRAGKRTSVFAIQAELDSWLQTRSTFRALPHAGAATYELVFQCAPIALGIVNDEREWVDANSAMCRLLGRSKDETITLRLDDVLVETDRGSLTNAWETMLAGGTISNSLLLRAPHRNPHWVEFHGIARFVPGLHLIMLSHDRSLADVVGGGRSEQQDEIAS
jgi:PAS domain S-box-containing protein